MRFPTPESAHPQTRAMPNENLAVLKQKGKSQTRSNPIFTRLQLLMKGVNGCSILPKFQLA
jgi:hypothetical protein